MLYLITLFQVCVLAVFLFFYNRILFSKGQLNLSAFHYVYYFVFYFFGAGILYVNGELENDRYFWSATLYPLISLAGMYAANTIYRGNRNVNLALNKNAIRVLYVCAAFIVIAYLSTLANIPLLQILQGDSMGASIARSQATKEYEGPKSFYYLFRLVVDYVFVFIAIHIYVKDRRVSKKLIFALCVLMLVAMADSQKYPAINILLLLFVAAFTLNRAKVPGANLQVFINSKTIFALLFAYIAIGIFWAAGSGRLSSNSDINPVTAVIESANSMVSDRLVFGQNRVLYVTYEIVPHKYDYFYGETFPNPLRLLPYEPVIFSYLTYDEIHPESIGGNVRGSGPAVFYSIIYANFGIFVSFLSMFAFGMFMQSVNNMLSYKNDSIIPYRFMWINYMALFSLSFDALYNSERFYFLILLFFFLFVRVAPSKA